MERISGTINRIIYQNPGNHYTVLDIDVDGGIISATGVIVSAGVGERITAVGEWYDHPNYGEQFKIQELIIEAPTDLQSVKSYLCSGMISGIGEKKAEDLLRHFGADVLRVIEEEPLRLTQVRGFGQKTALSIHESYMEQFEERNVVMAMTKYGITTNTALRLYKQYGGNAVAVLEKNPYQLIEDVYGIGFQKADAIASQIGIEGDSPLRIGAAVRYYLTLYVQKGYTYVPEKLLIQGVAQGLSLSPEAVEEVLASLENSGRVVLEENYGEGERRCYLPFLYDCERNCAQRLSQLAGAPPQARETDVLSLLEKYEGYTGVALDEIQKKAVLAAVTNRIMLLTGGPGTGKTTTIKAIIHVLSLMGRKFTLAAPTGRASKRMSEACGSEAKTIHRLLEYGYSAFSSDSVYDENGMSFGRNEDNPIEEDAIIIDEMSMVDVALMSHLLSAVDCENSSLILVGDADQLPSVGPGCVLHDLIESGVVEVVQLKRIFRQADESLIVANAHRINEGLMPQLAQDREDFLFFHRVTQQKISALILQIVSGNHYGALDLMKSDRLQVISPFKKGEAGVINLNLKLQALVNPPDKHKSETPIPCYTLREGDKVMQTKNDYAAKWQNVTTFAAGEGVFNGDMGVVQVIDRDRKSVRVLFEGERVVSYSFSELDCLTLAYAITIHKSQGSEFDTVMIPVVGGNPEFLSRNLIYTALTRAKKQAILIGEPRVLQMMIHNNHTQKRLSGLKERLVKP